LWEVHVIEGLEGDRFAIYMKMHHSLIDGVSGMRLLLRGMTTDADERGMAPFWTVGAGSRPQSAEGRNGGPLGRVRGLARGGVNLLGGLSRAAADLGRAAIDDSSMQAPYRGPHSLLSGHLTGQRRFATQRYAFDRIKAIATAGDCTLNDVVLYLSGTALRRYLSEHGQLPDRPLTAGIPVNLRDPNDESTGTAIGMMVANLATNIANPRKRLEEIKRSTVQAKEHLRSLPHEAQTYYALLVNGPYIAGLVAGLGHRAPLPFSVAVSNVPGPTETLYFNGARLDAAFPLSLLTHGNALNITCLSYAGCLNFGFTGARDVLPHLQRLAIYMGEAVEEIEDVVGVGAAA
jgi:WS/DGAT/MGAT family acyltransferase